MLVFVYMVVLIGLTHVCIHLVCVLRKNLLLIFCGYSSVYRLV